MGAHRVDENVLAAPLTRQSERVQGRLKPPNRQKSNCVHSHVPVTDKVHGIAPITVSLPGITAKQVIAVLKQAAVIDMGFELCSEEIKKLRVVGEGKEEEEEEEDRTLHEEDGKKVGGSAREEADEDSDGSKKEGSSSSSSSSSGDDLAASCSDNNNNYYYYYYAHFSDTTR